MMERMLAIVKEAGQIILNADNIQNNIQIKEGRSNFVTKYDVEVQNYLYQKLRELYPKADFVGEEDKRQGKITGEYCFIIDPIDGTTNFILGYQHSSVSVGLLHKGAPEAGIVYNPYLDEIFYAQKGKGAYLNGKLLRMQNLELEEGLISVGSCPYYRDKTDEVFKISRKLFDRASDIRRTGSAALDLCYVAANRFVLYADLFLCPWDYTAGSLIVTEAGGTVSTLEGTMLPYSEACSLIAATPASYKEYFRL